MTVSIIDDLVYEFDEVFGIVVESVDPSAVIDEQLNDANITITNNDGMICFAYSTTFISCILHFHC